MGQIWGQKLKFLGSCLLSFSNSWPNAVYQKNTVFTLFFKHLTISNHLSFCKKTRSFPCIFRPLFHSTVLKAKSYMLCSKMTFLDPSLCPPGAKTATTGPPFSPKRPPKVQYPSRPLISFSRPGRDQRPKTPEVTFSSIQGSILEWF